MVKKRKVNKFRFEFIKSRNRRQKFTWRIVACNGNIVGGGAESYLHKHGPIKTVNSLIKAIKKGEFTIEEYHEE